MADVNVAVDASISTSSTTINEEDILVLDSTDIVVFTIISIALIYFIIRKLTTNANDNNNNNNNNNSKINNTDKTRSNHVNSRSNASLMTKMKDGGKKVVVFYGSQTGTAEDYASRVSKDATLYGFPAMVMDIEDIEPEELTTLSEIEGAFAIFMLATYGEGEPTDNAQELYEWLKDDTNDTDMSSLKFCVFALGNRTYEHYNAMGIFVDERLAALGAERLYEMGDGDDDGNLEEDYMTWKEQLWPTICEHFGVSVPDVANARSERSYRLETFDVNPEKGVFTGEMGRLGSFTHQRGPYDVKNPYLAKVNVIRELHEGGDRSCLHIELELGVSKIRYDAGDHVAIYPTNNAARVAALGERLNIDLDTVFALRPVEQGKKVPFPCPCTYRTALLHYVDIDSLPRTHVLREFAEFTSDPKELELLRLLSSKEGKKKYHSWVVDEQRDVLQILIELPGISIPLDHLIEFLPRLQCRYYSISSSPKLYSNSIHVTATVVKYVTKTGREVEGVATSWLAAQIAELSHVPIYVRKSHFRLPRKTTLPVLMVGPGTGLAPFRGFIQERRWIRQESGAERVGDTVLFFGCRSSKHDFIYRDELINYADEGSLVLHTAFSRDQSTKIYVQDRLRENKAQVWGILEAGGYVYVCGDGTKMSKDVYCTIIAIVADCGNKSEAEAEAYVKRLQTSQRYMQDVWG